MEKRGAEFWVGGKGIKILKEWRELRGTEFWEWDNLKDEQKKKKRRRPLREEWEEPNFESVKRQATNFDKAR